MSSQVTEHPPKEQPKLPQAPPAEPSQRITRSNRKHSVAESNVVDGNDEVASAFDANAQVNGSGAGSEEGDQDNDVGTDPQENDNIDNPQTDVKDPAFDQNSQENNRQRRTKKCFNAQCQSGKIYKRIKSKIETSKYRSLCKACHGFYSRNQFCEFCEQIYDDTMYGDDATNWIGCDSCERWNHVSCQMKHRIKDANVIKQENLKYECLACTAKAKPKKQVDPGAMGNNKRNRVKQTEEDPYQYDKQMFKKKTARQTANEEKFEVYQNSNEHYVDVFNRKLEFTKQLETFLQTLGISFGISDEQIRDDLFRYRQNVAERERQVEQPEDETGEKKLKRRKK